jgi:hypothetical protein
MVQVHHDEEVANRIDPESCAVATRSDSWIGQMADVSNHLVARARKKTLQVGHVQVQKSATKIGKDGKRYPATRTPSWQRLSPRRSD